MTQKKICLASDNWAPTHPSIMKAIINANEGCAPPYGSDIWTEEATKIIQGVFKTQGQVFMVPSGTGSNVLALKLCCRRFESIICTDAAHINFQESGAAESIIGAKLLTVAHQRGKLTPEGVMQRLKRERSFGKHTTWPRVVSITQATEFGTVYSREELRSLAQLCKEENLLLHMDGSRIYNAAVKLDAHLYEITEAGQVDILSLGGTKNGLMGTEALVIFNKELFEGSENVHKQTLQLLSKTRYLSAQYIPFFTNKLWYNLAKHANEKAQQVKKLISTIPGFSLSYDVETNQIFFTAPEDWVALMQEGISFYPWDIETNELRFITSWYTSDEDIKRLKAVLDKHSKKYK